MRERWTDLPDIWKVAVVIGLLVATLAGLLEAIRFGILIGVVVFLVGVLGATLTVRYVFGWLVQVVLDSRRTP